MKRRIVTFCFLLVSFSVFSAENYDLSLEEAVDIALKNNLSLKSSEIALKTKLRNKKQVYNQLMPSLTAGVAVNRPNLNPGENMKKMFGGDSPIMPTSVYPDWTATFQINGALSLNGALFGAIANVKDDYECGLISYEDAKMTLAKNVKQAYFDLIYIEENVKLIQESFEMAEKRYQQAQKNYRSGLVPDVDLLQAQVSMENVRPQLIQAQNAFQTALLQFKINLGLEIEDTIELDSTVLDWGEGIQIELDATQLSNQFINNRYDIQSIRANIELLKSSKKTSLLSSMSPTLTISAGYIPTIGIFKSGVDDSKKSAQYKDWNDSGNVSFSLSIPVSSYIPGTAAYTKAAEIQDSIDSMHINLENSIRYADLEIKSLVMNIQSAQEQLEVLNSSVKLAQTVYQRYSDGYRLGTVEILDLENVESQLNQAKLNLISGKVTLSKALTDLEYAINHSLKEINAQEEIVNE